MKGCPEVLGRSSGYRFWEKTLITRVHPKGTDNLPVVVPACAIVISWSRKNMGNQEEKPDILEWNNKTGLSQLDGDI